MPGACHAEQVEQIKKLEEDAAKIKQKLAKLEALLASGAEVKFSQAPVFTENDSFDRNIAGEEISKESRE